MMPKGTAANLILVSLFVILVGVAILVLKHEPDTSPWIAVASVSEVRNAGVVYDEEHRIFLVQAGADVVGLSALDPHAASRGERVLYCTPSEMFEGVHGEKFDRAGAYYAGPAPRGLDSVRTTIMEGTVFIDPEQISPGPPRNHPRAENPSGPFCSGYELHEAAPGFAVEEVTR